MKLEQHLTPLQRERLISIWHDRQIHAGENWRRSIDANLDQAGVILLLVSADFVSSGYCSGIEMKRALERYRARTALVVPVILKPVLWSEMPFAELQALPQDGRPITLWSNEDEAFLSVAQGIRSALIAARGRSTGKRAPEAAKASGVTSKTIEECLKNFERGDIYNFFVARLNMGRNGPRSALKYEEAGKAHWYVAPVRKKEAKVTQIGRFDGDKKIWQDLGAKREHYPEKNNLVFYLKTRSDLERFQNTVENQPDTAREWRKRSEARRG